MVISRVRRPAGVVLVAAAIVTGAVDGAATAKPHRPLGDSRVVAQLPPAPGYPEGIAVRDGRVYVATAARFGTSVVPPLDPPEVQVFDRATGALVARHVVLDADDSRDHGLSGLAFDADGRLYVLDTQWGILRFDPATAPAVIDLHQPAHHAAYLYATAFEDLRPCLPLSVGPCSPAAAGDAPPLPNDLAFDAAGNLYVTDSLQATIWKVPPPAAPGQKTAPVLWVQDDRLAGGFGANGIRFDARARTLYVAVSADLMALGRIYRVSPDGVIEDEPFHTYAGADVPDNIAFGRSGRLYVALAGTNAIQVLSPAGVEIARYAGPARRDDAPAVPYDMPSGVAIDSATGAVLANNHSEVLGIPDRFVVFDVFVDDRSEPLVRPNVP